MSEYIPDEIKKLLVDKFGDEILDDTYGDDAEIKKKYREQIVEFSEKQKKIKELEEYNKVSSMPEKVVKFKTDSGTCKYCKKYHLYNNFDDDIYITMHGCCKECWYKIEELKRRNE